MGERGGFLTLSSQKFSDNRLQLLLPVQVITRFSHGFQQPNHHHHPRRRRSERWRRKMKSFSPVPGTPLDFFASNPAVTWPLGQINGFYRFSTATNHHQPAASTSATGWSCCVCEGVKHLLFCLSKGYRNHLRIVIFEWKK